MANSLWEVSRFLLKLCRWYLLLFLLSFPFKWLVLDIDCEERNSPILRVWFGCIKELILNFKVHLRPFVVVLVKSLIRSSYGLQKFQIEKWEISHESLLVVLRDLYFCRLHFMSLIFLLACWISVFGHHRFFPLQIMGWCHLVRLSAHE